jgi:hypothetical protein
MKLLIIDNNWNKMTGVLPEYLNRSFGRLGCCMQYFQDFKLPGLIVSSSRKH